MIEVGEYIRTKDGRIGKIEAIFKRDEYSDVFHTDINCDDYECKHYVYDFDIKSHSKNIIDLIEVGDIVKVYVFADISDDDSEAVETYYRIESKYETTELKESVKMNYSKILSILTHEMYEQNCYKVGED